MAIGPKLKTKFPQIGSVSKCWQQRKRRRRAERARAELAYVLGSKAMGRTRQRQRAGLSRPVTQPQVFPLRKKVSRCTYGHLSARAHTHTPPRELRPANILRFRGLHKGKAGGTGAGGRGTALHPRFTR